MNDRSDSPSSVRVQQLGNPRIDSDDSNILVTESEFGKITVLEGGSRLKTLLRFEGIALVKNPETNEVFEVQRAADDSIVRLEPRPHAGS